MVPVSGAYSNCRRRRAAVCQSCPSYLSTSGNALDYLDLNDFPPTTLFLDEAPQASEWDLVYLIGRFRKTLGKRVLRGDPEQLCPVIVSTGSNHLELQMSLPLFKHLEASGVKVQLLDTL
jgi:hypothetical protein